MNDDLLKALERAFEVASLLPDREQEELAAAILDEIEAERRWEASFGSSQDALKRLADEALAEHRAGKSEPLDPDALWPPGRRAASARRSGSFRRRRASAPVRPTAGFRKTPPTRA